MNIVMWVLVLSIYGESPLPDDLARHKEFRTYEECYLYRYELFDATKKYKEGFKRKYAQSVIYSCVPVSKNPKLKSYRSIKEDE